MVCALADQKYIKASYCKNSHGHMVLWWKRNADALHVALELTISRFTMAPGLSGMDIIGKERRKLLVMPEEVLSFSLFELCWPCV